MSDIDYRWWFLIVAQIVTGLTLIVALPADSELKMLGVGLIGGAFGQGATAKIGPTK